MGIVSFGAPRDIIEKLRSQFQVSTFVETGTYQGNTAAWAGEHFKHVFTIEGSPEFHRAAQERYRANRNIEFLLGDSRSQLREVVSRLAGTPALFWLDAHWMPGSFGEGHECPLLEEIAAIYQSATEHLILIDDARLFLAPPPSPHLAKDWPDINTVLSALNAPDRAPNYTVIYNDVIISVPAFAREPMQSFFQELTTALFLAQNQTKVHRLTRIASGLRRRLRRVIGVG